MGRRADGHHELMVDESHHFPAIGSIHPSLARRALIAASRAEFKQRGPKEKHDGFDHDHGSLGGVRLMRGRCCLHHYHLAGTATQTAREQTEARLRDRESLYGDFITEASRLAVDAISHSLDSFEKLVTLYGILGRVRLLAGERVLAEAERCCHRIVDLYARPNMSKEQIRAALETDQLDPLKEFAVACRAELLEIAAGVPARKGRL